MRNTQPTTTEIYVIQREITGTKEGAEVDDYETTEQVFSQQDAKDYRQAIGKRTKAKPAITRGKKKAVGKKGKTRSKAKR